MGSFLSGLAGALGGAGRGYESASHPSMGGQARQQGTPGQGGGPMMQYLRNRNNKPWGPSGPNPWGQNKPFDPNPPAQPTMDANTAMQASGGPPRMPPIQTSGGMPGLGIPGSPTPPSPPSPYDPATTGAGSQPMANGGVVTKPTTALIGEDGPEMVVPLTHRPNAKVSMANVAPRMNYGRRR